MSYWARSHLILFALAAPLVLAACGGSDSPAESAAGAVSEAPTLFTTGDYHQDRENWTDPVYFRNNTIGQLVGMSFDYDSQGEGTGQEAAARAYGTEGSGEDRYDLTSPYPFTSSDEHYRAWLEAASGGTQHTAATLPDWSGRWDGDSGWFGGRATQASSVAAVLTPEYREYFVQQIKAETEGRHFWPASFCLPRGFLESVFASPKEFILRPNEVWIIGDTFTENLVRWVYTDGSGHSAEARQFPRWHGETIGFWDGDALVLHTNQIKAWMRPIVEWSGDLSTVERYQRVGDVIEGEITLYDSNAFLQPLHTKFTYERIPDDSPLARPIYNTCTDTNGPSSNVFVNAEGRLDERTFDDPNYWDLSDPRPWASFYEIGE